MVIKETEGKKKEVVVMEPGKNREATGKGR